MRVNFGDCIIYKAERSSNVYGAFKHRPQWKPFINNINLNAIKTREDFFELFKALTDETGTFRISARNWHGRFVDLGTFIIGKDSISIPNKRSRLIRLFKE